MSTTQISSHNRLERAKKFLQEIKDRLKNDTGAKVAFKRALSGEHHHLQPVKSSRGTIAALSKPTSEGGWIDQ